jgi:hypothetical protein
MSDRILNGGSVRLIRSVVERRLSRLPLICATTIGALAAALACPATVGSREPLILGSAARLCDRAVGLRGSDAASGTLSHPYRSLRRLLGRMRPGEVGCLLGGVFHDDIRVLQPGRRGKRITIRSAPGVRSVVMGHVWVAPAANYITISNLVIDGSLSASNTVQVQGDHVTLRQLEITNRAKPGANWNGNCVIGGAYGERSPANIARYLLIDRTRIHDCGDDRHEHGIYLEFTRHTVIKSSYLYRNPGYGIHMYPDARETLIERNVIDGNSSQCKANLTFSGEAAGGEYDLPHGSRDNTVRFNLITFPVCRDNIESYYPSGSLAPVGNRVIRNCVYGAPGRNFGGTSGYSTAKNILRDPLYVNRGLGDFRLRAGSPCAGLGPPAVSRRAGR